MCEEERLVCCCKILLNTLPSKKKKSSHPPPPNFLPDFQGTVQKQTNKKTKSNEIFRATTPFVCHRLRRRRRRNWMNCGTGANRNAWSTSLGVCDEEEVEGRGAEEASFAHELSFSSFPRWKQECQTVQPKWFLLCLIENGQVLKQATILFFAKRHFQHPSIYYSPLPNLLQAKKKGNLSLSLSPTPPPTTTKKIISLSSKWQNNALLY